MLSSLVVVLGYECNFSCEHCIVSRKRTPRLTDTEKDAIAGAVGKVGFKTLLFIGGEPTLYIEDINSIVSRLGRRERIKIRLTTNGHFAKTRASAISMLSSIHDLSGINLSYDAFHKKFLSDTNVKNLYFACKELGMDFSVLLGAQSPLDLLLLKNLSKIGTFPVGIQKMLPYGSAQRNNISYRYPSFDRGVLSRHCPNKGKLVYLCGQGFTSCCSSLVFNNASSMFIQPTLDQHLASDFYKMISKSTFRELARKLGLTELKLLPEYSAPCVLCEYLYRSKFGENL